MSKPHGDAMSTSLKRMINEEYEPTENEELILEVLKNGRANPKWIKEKTALNDQQVNYALKQLIAAGWVKKLTKGLYELVNDPRGNRTEDRSMAE